MRRIGAPSFLDSYSNRFRLDRSRWSLPYSVVRQRADGKRLKGWEGARHNVGVSAKETGPERPRETRLESIMHITRIRSPKLKLGAPLLRPDALLVVIVFTGRGLGTNALTHTAGDNQYRLVFDIATIFREPWYTEGYAEQAPRSAQPFPTSTISQSQASPSQFNFGRP